MPDVAVEEVLGLAEGEPRVVSVLSRYLTLFSASLRLSDRVDAVAHVLLHLQNWVVAVFALLWLRQTMRVRFR